MPYFIVVVNKINGKRNQSKLCTLASYNHLCM